MDTNSPVRSEFMYIHPNAKIIFMSFIILWGSVSTLIYVPPKPPEAIGPECKISVTKEPKPIEIPRPTELTIKYPYLNRDLYIYIPSCSYNETTEFIMYNHGNSGGKSINNFYRGGFAFIKRDLEKLCTTYGKSYAVVAPILGEKWWYDDKLMGKIKRHDIEYLEAFLDENINVCAFQGNSTIKGIANHSGGYRWFDNVLFQLHEFDFVFAFDSVYEPELYSKYTSLNFNTKFYMNSTEHLKDRVFQVKKAYKTNVTVHYLGGHGMEEHYKTIRNHFYKRLKSYITKGSPR